jgi:hypothetical protein
MMNINSDITRRNEPRCPTVHVLQIRIGLKRDERFDALVVLPPSGQHEGGF